MQFTAGVVAVATGVAALAACGSDAASTGATDRPTIVATTSIWADIVANVACDGLADVRTIIPLGGDAHSFEPSLRDRETMENATLVVANGLLLEQSLDDTIRAVENGGTPVLRIGEELDLPSIADSDGDNGDDHHHAGDTDPHIWFDPTIVAQAVPVIADRLATAGVDRAGLATCSDAYLAELTNLDSDVVAIVAPLPREDRILVTNHDSLGYFAQRYDFGVLGSILPSSSSLAETNPADLDALADEIEAAGVPAIFSETQHSSADADALVGRLDGVDVVTLMTATLGEPGTAAGTYIGWLRETATTIVDALTPASAT